MNELNELLNPIWGAQKEIVQIWDQLNAEEKKIIKSRMDDLFKDGLPFELKHEKIVYIHIFSFIAQIDVMACQVPLKFESRMPDPLFKQRLRAQLLDEIFHVLLSIRIVNILCSPFQSPPIYNEALAQFCAVISNEECPKVALALLNSVLEGVAEELVKFLNYNDFAPKVFSIIVADEHRHVSDAEIYREIGLPDQRTVAAKVAILEEFILSSILIQYQLVSSLIIALGPEGMQEYIRKVDCSFTEQLKGLHLKPGKNGSPPCSFYKKCLYLLIKISLAPLKLKKQSIVKKQ
ncbi:MAG: hypothetical protein H0T84_11515 [Tatlockia sp.]|nr:hypothetical protein [Tatlockia sp.]